MLLAKACGPGITDLRTLTLLLGLLIVVLVGFVVYSVKFANPRVAQELRDNPDGSRAERVMLMTIGDRKTIPVNYLREDDQVFIGADGPWWREMQGAGQPVVMLIKGEILAGQARAIIDRPEYTREVFKRLRPDVPKWLPDWMRGVLVEIELTQTSDKEQLNPQIEQQVPVEAQVPIEEIGEES